MPAAPTVVADELLTVPECCRLLHVSKPTVYRLIGRGELRAVRLGSSPGRGQMVRVSPAALRAYLDTAGRRQEAARAE